MKSKHWIISIVFILLGVSLIGSPSISSALDFLFWDDFEDGTWEDKWINAAQGEYEIIDAAEYKKMYGHFPLDDPSNKGVLIFDGGAVDLVDHSFVAKAGPFSFDTAEGVTFESMAQWVVGDEPQFVLSVSETDTSDLDRNLAYFDAHVRVVLTPVGDDSVLWIQTHWPIGNHITHTLDTPGPPADKFSKVSLYLDEEIYKVYVDGELVHEGKHECGMKEGYMSWSVAGGWGHIDNVVIYTGDYDPKAFEIASSVEPAQKLFSTWSAIKSQH